MNYLPINTDIIAQHHSDCWAYYCYLRRTVQDTYMNFDRNITIKLTLREEQPDDRIYADLCRSSWTKYKTNWEKKQVLILDTPTTMMPLQVFDILYDLIKQLPIRSRNSYLVLYLLLYYRCHSALNDYGITVERLAAELKTNHSLISQRLKFFIDAGFLRRMGKYNPDLGIPYRYFIPSEYCSKLN